MFINFLLDGAHAFGLGPFMSHLPKSATAPLVIVRKINKIMDNVNILMPLRGKILCGFLSAFIQKLILVDV